MKQQMTGILIVLLWWTVPLQGQTDNVILCDGVVGMGEWKGATLFEMEPRGSLQMKKVGDTLFIAVSGEEKIWCHLYLSDGERVKIMHASAALDDVEYKKVGVLWRTSDSFQWTFRDTAYNDETARRMGLYFNEHGWVSNNVQIGDGKTIEFKCSLKEWKGKKLTLAVVTSEYDMNMSAFPPFLDDHTRLPRLVQGFTPDSLSFTPVKWHAIVH